MKKILISAFVIILLVVALTAAYAGGLLSENQQSIFNSKKAKVDSLVQNKTITQEKADSFLIGFERKLVDSTCGVEGEDCEHDLDENGECSVSGQDGQGKVVESTNPIVDDCCSTGG